MKRNTSLFILIHSLLLFACPAAKQVTNDAGQVLKKVECKESALEEQKIQLGKTGSKFTAFKDGGVLYSWLRPQGGVGSRSNFLISGFEADIDSGGIANVSQVQHIILFKNIDANTSDHSCQQNICPNAQFCYQNQCHEVVSENGGSRFVLDKAMFCLDNGSLHIPEVPVRFNKVGDAEADALFYDNKEVIYFKRLTRTDESYIDSQAVNLTIRIGDFEPPSWWQDSDF